MNKIFKMKTFKKAMLNENEMYLHNEKVEVAKLTPVKWRELFAVVDKLPGLVIQVVSAPQDDFYAYVLQALDIALDEVINVTSILTGVDKQYIENNVGLDELAEYLFRMVKRNRLDDAVKKMTSLQPKT